MMHNSTTDRRLAELEAELETLHARMRDLELQPARRRWSSGQRAGLTLGLILLSTVLCLGGLTAAGIDPFYIDDNGHVHISPHLKVAGTADITGEATVGSLKATGEAAVESLKATGNTRVGNLRVENNVGIGTPDPTHALEVRGAFRVYQGDNYFRYNGGADLSLSAKARGSGGRALVHDSGNRLTINYGNDFTGGVGINGGVRINGDLLVRGTKLNTYFVHWQKNASQTTDEFYHLCALSGFEVTRNDARCEAEPSGQRQEDGRTRWKLSAPKPATCWYTCFGLR